MSKFPAPDIQEVQSMRANNQFPAPDPQELAAMRAEQQNPQEDPGKLVSTLTGVGQGVTAGFGDELYGAVNNPIGAAQAIANLVGANVHTKDTEEYEAKRDAARKYIEATEKAHPYLSTGGKIVGSLIPAGAIAKGIGALGLLPEVASATGYGAKALAGGLEGAATGAGYGAIQGAGESSSKDNIGHDIGQGLMLGGATGGVLGATLPVAGQALKDTHGMMKNLSGTYNDLSQVVADEMAGIKDVGRDLYDNTVKDLRSSTEKTVKKIETKISDLASKTEEARSNLSPMDVNPIIEDVNTELGAIAKKKGYTEPSTSPEVIAEIQDAKNQILQDHAAKVESINNGELDHLPENYATKIKNKQQELLDLTSKDTVPGLVGPSLDSAQLGQKARLEKEISILSDKAKEAALKTVQKETDIAMKSVEAKLAEVTAPAKVVPNEYIKQQAPSADALEQYIKDFTERWTNQGFSMDKLPAEAQAEFRTGLKNLSPIESTMNPEIQQISESQGRKPLEQQMRGLAEGVTAETEGAARYAPNATPENIAYDQSMQDLHGALNTFNQISESGNIDPWDAKQQAKDIVKMVGDLVKSENGDMNLLSTLKKMNIDESIANFEKLGMSDVAQQLQDLQAQAQRTGLLGRVNSEKFMGKDIAGLAIRNSLKVGGLAARGARSAADFTVLNQNISDRLSDPLFVKSLANQMENAPIPQAAKNIFRQLSDTQDVGKQKAVQNVIMNTPALRGILQKMVGSENGSEK